MSFWLHPLFTYHETVTMKFLTIFPLLMVTLLARNRKHYLVEVEDKNEIIDEKDMNEYEEENVFNHEEKNTEKGKNVKPRKVFKSFRYFVTNINNTTKYIDYHRERPSRTKHLDALIEPGATEDQGMKTVTARVQTVR